MGQSPDPRERILARRAALWAAALSSCSPAVPTPVHETQVTPTATDAPTASPAPAPSATASPTVSPAPAPTASAAATAPEPLAMVCLSIRILEQLRFGLGATTLTPDHDAVLDTAADILIHNPHLRVALEGHAESEEVRYGQRPGLKRAKAVEAALRARGVPAEQLCTRFFGDTRPITPGETEQQRAANRRVELNLLEPNEDC